MRAKSLLIVVASLIVIGSIGVWLHMSEQQAARERRDKFFGSSKTYPTTGGEKMKIEW